MSSNSNLSLFEQPLCKIRGAKNALTLKDYIEYSSASFFGRLFIIIKLYVFEKKGLINSQAHKGIVKKMDMVAFEKVYLAAQKILKENKKDENEFIATRALEIIFQEISERGSDDRQIFKYIIGPHGEPEKPFADNLQDEEEHINENEESFSIFVPNETDKIEDSVVRETNYFKEIISEKKGLRKKIKLGNQIYKFTEMVIRRALPLKQEFEELTLAQIQSKYKTEFNSFINDFPEDKINGYKTDIKYPYEQAKVIFPSEQLKYSSYDEKLSIFKTTFVGRTSRYILKLDNADFLTDRDVMFKNLFAEYLVMRDFIK